MPAEIFQHHHRVTYAECTVGNHVYHSRYLDMLEAARGEFCRALGQPFEQLQHAGFIFPVIECQLRYRAPARYDDCLTIELWLTDLGRARLTFAYRVLGPGGKLLLEASTEHACTNLEEKPKRVPAPLAEQLGRFLHPPAVSGSKR
ncbi:thioesterase [Verrucomicrobiota bacterium]|nr:thioesterase [Verrucomicrobiota bacterium]